MDPRLGRRRRGRGAGGDGLDAQIASPLRRGRALRRLAFYPGVDIVRKDTRRKRREAEVGIDDLFEHDDPGKLMERTEFANAVADAVRRLPKNQREVFVQNALEMKTFKEISEATGAPMGTLMARKKKAVDTIRGRLNRQGYSL